MPVRPPIAVAISFVAAINRRDLAALGALMTDDHALVVFDEPPLWTLVADTPEHRHRLGLPSLPAL